MFKRHEKDCTGRSNLGWCNAFRSLRVNRAFSGFFSKRKAPSVKWNGKARKITQNIFSGRLLTGNQLFIEFYPALLLRRYNKAPTIDKLYTSASGIVNSGLVKIVYLIISSLPYLNLFRYFVVKDLWYKIFETFYRTEVLNPGQNNAAFLKNLA